MKVGNRWKNQLSNQPKPPSNNLGRNAFPRKVFGFGKDRFTNSFMLMNSRFLTGSSLKSRQGLSLTRLVFLILGLYSGICLLGVLMERL